MAPNTDCAAYASDICVSAGVSHLGAGRFTAALWWLTAAQDPARCTAAVRPLITAVQGELLSGDASKGADLVHVID